MKFRTKAILLAPLAIFVAIYCFAAVKIATDGRTAPKMVAAPAPYQTIAIFGATGTAGDGILKAALADTNVQEIQVITRRLSPRIEEGVASGKVKMTLHSDYLDYAAIHEQISEVDAVFWAIGISSVGVDEETYGQIHVDFPLQFVTEWSAVSKKSAISFHYISSSDISEDSTAMWAREKVRAENALFRFAKGSKLRVVAYRPDYIGPTEEEASLGQNLLYWFFAPVGAAVRAQQIGQAMIEVAARGAEFENGAKLHTGKIIRYSDAYEN